MLSDKNGKIQMNENKIQRKKYSQLNNTSVNKPEVKRFNVVNKGDYIMVKSFYAINRTIKKMQSPSTEWDKICANYSIYT